MKALRSLLISCLLALALAHSSKPYPASLALRQASTTPAATVPPAGSTPTPTLSTDPPANTSPANPPAGGTDTKPPAGSTSTTDTAQTKPTDTATTPTSTSPTNTATNPPTDTGTGTPTPTPTSSNGSPTTPPPASQTTPPPNNQSPTPSTFESVIATTNADGVTFTLTTTMTGSASTPVAAPTDTPQPDSDSGGLGTGSIVGLSVAGGVAVIGIVAFFIWKFTRKRFGDFDDNEAIKWPELNAHGGGVDSHPLPVHNTGRAGFDTASEVSLSRTPSTSNYSVPEHAVGGDPYAVPPLPHLNPNQPYRDDPGAISGYYDPYRGPVPGTLEGEAIPMTQMAIGGTGGRNSPGPQGYDIGRSPSAAPAYSEPYDAGRRSPGPQVAYGRSSPGPQLAYGGGRASPGPQAAYASQPGSQAYGPR